MDMIQAIKKAGVVGAGGAGFPTHIKLNTQVEVFIVNGIECEPLLETDKYLMRTYAEELVDIIDTVAAALHAKRWVIGVKDKNVVEIKALEKAVAKKGSPLEVKRVQNYYPAGDEHILVQEICGKSIPPMGLPLDVGAVVANVATLLDVKNALEGNPVTTRLITVTGAVKRPTLIQVPIGTSIAQCIELAGGPSLSDYAVLLGGPMMGTDCPKDKISETYVTKTLGGIVLVEASSYLITMKRLPMSHIIRRAESACIQCQMCTDLCPRYLNGHPLYPHKVMRAVGMHEQHPETLKSALICCECGVCELYACPMGLSPKTVNQFVKRTLSKEGVRFEPSKNTDYKASDLMPYRKIHTSRMVARTGLTAYADIHLETVIDFQPQVVKLHLKQGIGSPAVPCVQEGAWVTAGDLIAAVEDTTVGSQLHASISGQIHLDQQAIWIRAVGQREDAHD
jgi:Na+-translocating ferredoxin:NAD+ oxidoreductase RnfC subunit